MRPYHTCASTPLTPPQSCAAQHALLSLSPNPRPQILNLNPQLARTFIPVTINEFDRQLGRDSSIVRPLMALIGTHMLKKLPSSLLASLPAELSAQMYSIRASWLSQCCNAHTVLSIVAAPGHTRGVRRREPVFHPSLHLGCGPPPGVESLLRWWRTVVCVSGVASGEGRRAVSARSVTVWGWGCECVWLRTVTVL